MSFASITLPTAQANEVNLKETVASYMSDSLITLSRDMKVSEAREHMLKQLRDEDIPAQIFVIDGSRFLHGQLSVKRLLTETDPTLPVSALMGPTSFVVEPNQQRRDIVPELIDKGVDLAPVVSGGKLLGALYEKEIAALIRDEGTDDAQRQGASLPLETSYLESSPWSLWKKRLPWLLLLFFAEAYTSTILQVFEEQLEAAIALAFFIPLLIGTGGNSGTQITTTIVRAMAVGEVSLRNLGTVLKKEISTGLLISAAIALAAWVRAWSLGVGPQIGMVVTLTIIAIVLWSATVASVIPMVLRRFRIDPAVVSAPFIATLVDGTGLIIYFEIAKLLLPELQ